MWYQETAYLNDLISQTFFKEKEKDSQCDCQSDIDCKYDQATNVQLFIKKIIRSLMMRVPLTSSMCAYFRIKASTMICCCKNY